MRRWWASSDVESRVVGLVLALVGMGLGVLAAFAVSDFFMGPPDLAELRRRQVKEGIITADLAADRAAADRAQRPAAEPAPPATAPAPALPDANARRAEARVKVPPRDPSRSVSVADSKPRERPRLAGRWIVTNTVDRATLPDFRGLELGYHLILEQDGARITGEGRKWTENGRRVPGLGRTPIHVVGEVRDDGRLVLDFTELGRRRASRGRFVWTMTDDGQRLAGSFESDAASSSGTSAARRVP
ncbi:MAG TPA: hypothetical protein VFD92_05415 [Candidatus Binatia bacterium]|nr:hypothetical protein [Candidatus Binatia bacterium]